MRRSNQRSLRRMFSIYRKVSKTCNRRSTRILQRQHCSSLVHIRIEVEVQLLEIVDVSSTRIIVDVQRIAPHVFVPIRRTAAAIYNACDLSRIVAFPIAEIDRVACRVAMG